MTTKTTTEKYGDKTASAKYLKHRIKAIFLHLVGCLFFTIIPEKGPTLRLQGKAVHIPYCCFKDKLIYHTCI